MKHLVVAPHPDDMELGMGGYVHRLTSQGHTVDLAVVTGPGDLKMQHSQQVVAFEQRVREQQVAADLLGIHQINWLNFAPASCFDANSQSRLVSLFDGLFLYYDCVYIPLPSYNRDHRVVWEAALASTRPGRCDGVTIWAYEQPMQNHGEPSISGTPGKIYAKMSQAELDFKVGALLCHESQMAGREMSLTGMRGVRALAEFRGAEMGTDFAELFYLIRTAI